MTDKKTPDRPGRGADPCGSPESGGKAGGGKAGGGSCPICGKPTEARVRPFCSKRCQHLDLARWLDGSYRVPSEEPADPDDLPREDEE